MRVRSGGANPTSPPSPSTVSSSCAGVLSRVRPSISYALVITSIKKIIINLSIYIVYKSIRYHSDVFIRK